MSAPWPPGFPYPSRANYSSTLGPVSQRTEFANAARQRQLYSDTNDRFTISLRLTAAQCAYFFAWVRYTLSGGTGWMQMPLQAAGLVTQREARFIVGSEITTSALGPNDYQISAQIETRQGTTMSEADFELLEFWGDPDLAGPALQALENMINTEDF